MKVKILTTKGSWSLAGTGKGMFVQRLIKALEEKNVEVTSKQYDSADIELGIGKFMAPKHRVNKRVVRIGPSHFDTNQNWKQLNKRKAEAVRNSDGVIYQSRWSQNVGRIYLGDGKLETVIFNGHPIVDFPGHRMLLDTAVMSTRKWVSQKRLKNTLQIFRDNFTGSPYKLMVLGECDKKLIRKFNSDNILIRGPVSQQDVKNVLSHAKFMIHPVWLDACPNSVVEAIAHGCSVLCSDQGGTKEIAISGERIPEEPWDFKPVNLNKPPKMDSDIWANAIKYMFNVGFGLTQHHIDINNIADQYIEFFKKVLNNYKLVRVLNG